MVCGGIVQGAPVLTLLFYLVIGGWVTSVNRLGNMFEERDRAAAAEHSHKDEDKKDKKKGE